MGRLCVERRSGSEFASGLSPLCALLPFLHDVCGKRVAVGKVPKASKTILLSCLHPLLSPFFFVASFIFSSFLSVRVQTFWGNGA